jgi:indolepyruvate ferredoxin oxidoreductase alpha subunit
VTRRLLLGNDAIALALVREGCRVATAYPGTPSTEILAGVVKFKRQFARDVYTEWSANEKIAFEVALAASWSGLRAAVAMKQVGLNVAADALFSAAYTGVVGGLVVVVCDDPGPHSSQTEQDSRLLALVAKVPVLDPATPIEAMAMVASAFALSERHRVPVILRPTTRVCHALQAIAVDDALPPLGAPVSRFRKDPPRFAATPAHRLKLHHELNAKLAAIEGEFEQSAHNIVVERRRGETAALGIIASGPALFAARDAIAEWGGDVPMLKIGTPYPLPRQRVAEFVSRCTRVLVLEEPDACIELQIGNRNRIAGRRDGSVPNAGELTPEIVASTIGAALRDDAGIAAPSPREDPALANLVEALALPPRRPRLCPGCSHRSAFFSLRTTFGMKAIYAGDIGCYTLGTNLSVVDTCVDMGASITMASGFAQVNRLTGDARPVVATIGDSTFLHSGIAALVNAVHANARFVLLILDNHTTAMTGAQPTPANDFAADGGGATRVSIEALVRACGVGFVRTADPYAQREFEALLKDAHAHTQTASGGVAVIIADRPCVLYDDAPVVAHPVPVRVADDCDGCRRCTEHFECPSLVLAADKSRVDIDYATCIDCGQCIDACHKGLIVPAPRA